MSSWTLIRTSLSSSLVIPPRSESNLPCPGLLAPLFRKDPKLSTLRIPPDVLLGGTAAAARGRGRTKGTKKKKPTFLRRLSKQALSVVFFHPLSFRVNLLLFWSAS